MGRRAHAGAPPALRRRLPTAPSPSPPLPSGNTFDIGLLNLLGVYIGFEKGQGDAATVTAASRCLVYTWGVDELNHLTTRCAPAVPAFWRNFALCQVRGAAGAVLIRFPLV